MTPLTVSVVIVTWNGLDLTLRCLDSLRSQQTGALTVELVVVDNGSADETVPTLTGVDDVKLVALPTNTGFAGGVNAGIRASSGEIVVLLNNDAVAEHDFLRHLTAPFTTTQGQHVGATTGRVVLSGRFVMVGPDAPADLVAHDATRWARTGSGGICLLNSTGNEVTRSGNGRDRGWLSPADGPAAPVEVFGFNGGCAALRRTALDDVGLFDQSLFMYYEDTELSWRLRRAGWTVQHVPDAHTIHDHAASSGTQSSTFLDNNERNRLVVALMHAPWPVAARACGHALARAILGPDRRRRLRVLRDVAIRTPAALRRRRATDRASRVPRTAVARFLVPDGGR